ncbi:TPA: phage major capsid protein [Streptococcus pyogenes]
MSFFRPLGSSKVSYDDYISSVLAGDVSQKYLGVSALKNSDILTATSIIAGDIARFPLVKKDVNGDIIHDEDINYLLNVKSTKNASARTWKFAMAVNAILTGNSFSRILRDPKTNEALRFEGKDEVLIPLNQTTPIDPKTDGVKKTDVKPVSSEEILYTPAREVKTVVDLKQFTSIHPAKKASGKWPVLQCATEKMVSVEELEKNPKLAKPKFKDVEWKVETYRGAIPLSQESIDDADVDLVGIVAETIGQMKVNTTNDAIAKVLKTFEPKADVKTLDEIKKILNVDLDPAYNVSFIVSQSFYQSMDTLKDENGRYLLQDSITSVTGKVFLGKPVFVLADEVLGKNKAFVGDFKRGVLFADRKDLGLRWVDNDIYGQYLQAVLRFGVAKVDDKAGYYVTFTPEQLPS